MKLEKSGQEKDPVSLCVHSISNLLCSIRLHANSFLEQEHLREAAEDILTADREIETAVTELALLARRTRSYERNGEEGSVNTRI